MDALRHALGRALTGQPDAVSGLLLALVAREHAWLEGPPGCGKTRLAEALAPLCGARSARLGSDAGFTLVRERAGTRERIRRVAERSPLHDAEIAVLDDAARCDGPELSRWLGALERRRLGGVALPLETAVATGRPDDTGLDPAALDLFAVQVRLRGLLTSRSFDAARELARAPRDARRAPVLDRATRRAAQEAAAALAVDPAARDALARALARLRSRAHAGSLSDRSFGPVALRLMRAHAWLRGADRVEAVDVAALRFTLARRVPELEPDESEVLLRDAATPVAGAGTRSAASEGGAGASDEPVAPPIERAVPDARPADPGELAEIAALVSALEGALGRGAAGRREDPGGAPRSWRELRGLDEALEADPAELWLWASGAAPERPRVPRRERHDRGGAVALLRDVSASMEGRLSSWAGHVVSALAELGRRRRLRLGYVEFNHAAERFAHGRSFFHDRYDAIAALGGRRRADGRTSYQAPLSLALGELARAPDRERHVVLLTDGVPVVGDPEVRAERATARRLGVRVHTVFIGTGPRPRVLDRLARETGGLGFRARPRAGRGISVEVACTNA